MLYFDEKCDKIDDDAITKINKRSDLRAGICYFLVLAQLDVWHLFMKTR